MRYKPHIKNISAEANVMFSLNKASAWLESKNTEEMNKLLKNAYKNVEKNKTRELCTKSARTKSHDRNMLICKKLYEKLKRLDNGKQQKIFYRRTTSFSGTMAVCRASGHHVEYNERSRKARGTKISNQISQKHSTSVSG
jgi:hypothetical protein